MESALGIWSARPLVRALYAQCESCVCILGIKSDSYRMGIGPCQGCALLPLLFVTFTDRVLRRSQGQEGLVWGSLRVSSLLFSDDVVLLAPLHECFQYAVERFAAQFEVHRPFTEKDGMPSPGRGREPTCANFPALPCSGEAKRHRKDPSSPEGRRDQRQLSY